MSEKRNDLTWEEIKTEHIVKDEWIDFRKSAYLYMAENCRRVAGQRLDETEFLNVELHTEGEIEELIAKGEFQQCVHITAWLLSRRK